MNREEARYYLQSSGFSEEQINTIEQAFKPKPTDDATLRDIFCMGCEYKEQEPCNTCGYEEGSIYCKEHCPYEAKIEQEPCEDAISRQAAQAKIKSICDKYRLSYEDGERKAVTGGLAYALGHAFDDLPPVTREESYVNIPYLMHKEMDIPISECQKAYDVAVDYLRIRGKLKG